MMLANIILFFWEFFILNLPIETLVICVLVYFHGSFMVFGLINWLDTTDDKTVMVEYLNKLDKKYQRRIFLLSFFLGVPNKVWTKTEYGMFFRFGAFLSVFFLSLFSKACFFIFIWALTMFFVTGLLAVAYERDSLFISAVQIFFFGQDKDAAASYFLYFGGNVSWAFFHRLRRDVKPSAVFLLGLGGYHYVEKEEHELQARTDVKYQSKLDNARRCDK